MNYCGPRSWGHELNEDFDSSDCVLSIIRAAVIRSFSILESIVHQSLSLGNAGNLFWRHWGVCGLNPSRHEAHIHRELKRSLMAGPTNPRELRWSPTLGTNIYTELHWSHEQCCFSLRIPSELCFPSASLAFTILIFVKAIPTSQAVHWHYKSHFHEEILTISAFSSASRH